MSNTKKWVLITGASTGIGRVSAEYLADHEFNVYGGVRKEKDFQELKPPRPKGRGFLRVR